MKHLRTYFLLLVIAALSGCGTDTKIIGGTTEEDVSEGLTYSLTKYTYEEYGFSISFPDRWDIVDMGGVLANDIWIGETHIGSMYGEVEALTSEYRQSGEFVENVKIVFIPMSNIYTEQEVDELFRRDVEITKATTLNFNEIGSGKIVIDNHIVRWIHSSRSLRDIGLKMSMEQFNYWFMDGRRLFVVYCSADAKRFSAYRGLFEDIARSFRFE